MVGLLALHQFFFKTIILLQLDLVTYTNKNNSAYFFFSHFNLYIPKYHIDIIGVEGFLFYVIGQQCFGRNRHENFFFLLFKMLQFKKKKIEFSIHLPYRSYQLSNKNGMPIDYRS